MHHPADLEFHKHLCSYLLDAMCCMVVVYAGATDDAINAAREAFHRHLAATQKSQQHVQDTSEEDLSQADERELDAEFAGQSHVTLFFSL